MFFVAKYYIMVTELRQDRVWACADFRIFRLMEIFPTVFSFWLTSLSGVEGLWILRVQLLETLDSIEYELNCVKPFLKRLFR